MRRKWLLITIAVSLTILTIPQNIVLGQEVEKNIIHSGTYGKGYRYNIQGWVYIHIEGEPYERGYQYGYLASAEIVDMINRWSNWAHKERVMKIFFRKNYEEKSQLWWEICKTKAMKTFWPQFPDEFKEEIKGIAEGVAEQGGMIHGKIVTFEDILTLNVVEETRQMINHPGGRGTPIRDTLRYLKNELFKGIVKESYEPGHCTAFIATGDATTDGRIVMAHSTIFPPNYIPQRANIILDVKPTNGHRFIMSSFPGYIWSSEDFYQNENGIMLLETSMPQGPWKTKGTLPVGVRARRAIQYSDNIDDVIKSMKNGNNGLYPNDWVMGDTKTGEIASLQLALRNQAVTRKTNGYIWSCCNPKDDKVRWELFSIFGFGMPGRVIKRKWKPTEIDLKFEELLEQNYGIIDSEIAKNIMSTEPICRITTDCKITDSELLEKFGMWAHMGNPGGKEFVPTDENKQDLRDIQVTTPCGWVNLFGSISKPTELDCNRNTPKKSCILLGKTENRGQNDIVPTVISNKNGEIIVKSSSGVYDLDTSYIEGLQGFSDSATISKEYNNKIYIGAGTKYYAFDVIDKDLLWEYEAEGVITKSSSASKNNVFFGAWDGHLYALDEKTGELKWKFKTGWGIDTTPAVDSGVVYIGSNDNNFYAIDEKTGELMWYFTCKSGIHASPVVYGEYVFFGSDDGYLYALDKKTGELVWNFAPEYTIIDGDVNNFVTTPILNSPIVEDGVVYIEVKETVYALDAQTFEGNVILKSNNDEGISPILISLILLFLISITLLVNIFIKSRKKTG